MTVPQCGRWQRFKAYLNGMREFRRDLTMHSEYPLIETYDRGRDRAHALTLRRWDGNR